MRGNLMSGKAVIAAAVVVALAGGTAATALLMGDDRGYVPHPASVTRFDFGAAVAPPVSFDRPSLPDPRPAPDARTAVDRFLAALVAGDDDSSFALLRGVDRTRLGSVPAWTAALTGRAPIRSYAVEAAAPDPSGTGAVDVTVRVTRAPQLDPFIGFVPATAVESWRADPMPGGWGVAPEPLASTAVVLPERQATADVQRWLDSRGGCRASAQPAVLGSDRLRALLCSDDLRAGETVGYGEVDGGEALLTSYGPDVADWSRFVPVRGPGIHLVVAVAPLGAAWTVVAVLPGDGSEVAR